MIVWPPANQDLGLGGIELLQGVNDAVKRIALPLSLAERFLGRSDGLFNGVAAGRRYFGSAGRATKCHLKKNTDRKGERKRF